MQWVRDKCKKRELCEFLHVYDKNKLPICKFLKDFGKCLKGELC